MGQIHKDICVLCEYSSKGDLDREDCNNKLDRKTRSVDTSQPLPTITLPSPSELMNTVAMVVGMDVMPGL